MRFNFFFLLFFIVYAAFSQVTQTHFGNGDNVAGNKTVNTKNIKIFNNIQNNFGQEIDRQLLYTGFHIADLRSTGSVTEAVKGKYDSLYALCEKCLDDTGFFRNNKSNISKLILEIFEIQGNAMRESTEAKAKNDYNLIKRKTVLLEGRIIDSISHKGLGDVRILCLESKDTVISVGTGNFIFTLNKLDFKDTNYVEIEFEGKDYESKMIPFALTSGHISKEVLLVPVKEEVFKFQVELSGAINLKKNSEFLTNLSVQRRFGKYFEMGVGITGLKTVYSIQINTLSGLPASKYDTAQLKLTFGPMVKFTPFHWKIMSPSIGVLLSRKTQQAFLETNIKIVPRLFLGLYLNYSNTILQTTSYDFNYHGNATKEFETKNYWKFSAGINLIYNFNVDEL